MHIISIPLDAHTSGESFLQTHYWAALKKKSGWKPCAFRIVELDMSFVVLVKTVGKLLSVAYIPRVGAPLSPEQLPDFAQALKKALKSLHLGIISCEFDYEYAAELPVASGWHKSKHFIQPEASVIVSLGEKAELQGGTPEQQLKRREYERLMNIHSKTRNIIKRAEKNGVRCDMIAMPSRRELSEWYELMQSTAKRQGFALRSLAYYEQMVSLASDAKPNIYLARAYAGETLVSGYFMLGYNGCITSLYGGSRDEGLRLGAPSLLFYNIMNRAERLGYKSFDMWGIPRNADDPDMGNLYSFKTKFGGAIVQYPGTWYTDISVLAPLYRIGREVQSYLRKRGR